VTIRPATDADKAGIRGMRWAWLEENDGHPVDDTGFADVFDEWWALEAGHRRFWVAEVDGGLIGMVSVVTMRRMPQPGRTVAGWGYVHQMYVRPEHRNAGVGAELLAAAAATCRDEGFQHLLLHPTERAVPFYAREGFVPADFLLTRDLSDPST
jgi:GNAT superfamily N-acetyltransferase